MNPVSASIRAFPLVNTTLLATSLLLSSTVAAVPQGTYRGQSSVEFLLDLQANGGAAGHALESSSVYGIQWVIDGSGNITPSVLSEDYVFVDTNNDQQADSWVLQSTTHRSRRLVGSNYGGYSLLQAPGGFSAPAFTSSLTQAGVGLYEADINNTITFLSDTSLRAVITSTPSEDLLVSNVLVNDFLSGGKNLVSSVLGIFAKMDTLYPTTAADLNGKSFHGVFRTREYVGIDGYDAKYTEAVSGGLAAIEFTSTSACVISALERTEILQFTIPDLDGDSGTVEGDQDYRNRLAIQIQDSSGFDCTYSVDSSGRIEIRADPGGEGEFQLFEFYSDASQRYLVSTDSGNSLDSTGEPVGGGEGTEGQIKGLGLFLRVAAFDADQDTRNDAAAGTFLLNYIASDYESGLLSNWSPEFDQFGRAVLEFSSAAAAGHTGFNQCSFRDRGVETEKADSGTEAGGDVSSDLNKFTSPLEEALDCRFRIHQSGGFELVLTFEDDGGVEEVNIDGRISNNYEALTLALAESGTVIVEGTDVVDESGLIVVVGVQYSGDLSANQDDDEFSNEDEFFVYRGQDSDDDGDPNSTDPDDDNDGISDIIELANPTFLHPWNAADGQRDQDGDGFSNAAEALAGTSMTDPEDKPGTPFRALGFWTHLAFNGSYHEEQVCREDSGGYLNNSGDFVPDPFWVSYCAVRGMAWWSGNLDLFIFADQEQNPSCDEGSTCSQSVVRDGNYLDVGARGMVTADDGMLFVSHYDFNGNPLRDENWDPSVGDIEYGVSMVVQVASGLSNNDLVGKTYAVAAMSKSFAQGDNAQFSETNLLLSFDLSITGDGTCVVSNWTEHKLEQLEDGDNDFDDRTNLYHSEAPVSFSVCSFSTDAASGELQLTLTPTEGDPGVWALRVTPDFNYLASSNPDASPDEIGFVLGVSKATPTAGDNAAVAGAFFIAGMDLDFWNYTDTAFVGYDGDGIFRAVLDFSGAAPGLDGFSDCSLYVASSSSGRGLSGDVGVDAAGWAWIEGEVDDMQACRYRVNAGGVVEVEETLSGESPESIFFQLGADGNALLFSEVGADLEDAGFEEAYAALGLGIKYSGSNYIPLIADFLDIPVTQGEVSVPSNLTFIELWDMNGDGVQEVGQFGLRLNNNKPQLIATDPTTGSTVRAFTWDDNWDNPEIVRLADRTGDGVDELALFGFAKADQRPQLSVKNGASAAAVNTFSWPANWYDVQFQELDDSTGDGISEVAIFGFANGSDQAKLVVRDGADPAVSLPTASWPAIWNNVRFLQTPDLNGDGVDEVAIYGQRAGNGRNQLVVKDGVDPSILHEVFNWGNNWDDQQVVILDDMTADGIGEVALAGVRKDDGRAQMIVRDGSDRSQNVRNYGWPAELTGGQYLSVPDRDGDGIAELGMVGVRSDNGRTQVIVKRGSSRQTLEAAGWASNWTDTEVHVLADLSSDSLPDYALLGNHVLAGYAQLVVNDSATGGVLRTFSWPSMDATRSTLVEVADMNGDGVPEVGLYSAQSGVGVLQIKNGANQAQVLSTVTWPAAWY
ncbi:MAG: hypothetical protein GYB33_12865 [Gammaproteobacteria bacterium]|nr:hypothetical protein [Gammaproteobacteria bacterium]